MRAELASFSVAVAALLFTTPFAHAQDDPYECDDRYAECGTPQQSGGGGGGGGGGSILINNTDLGDTYQYADDYDDDGVEDPYDNCPWVANPDQVDDDGDEVGTACDNCPQVANQPQDNLDGDAQGDVCDADIDGDGIDDDDDLCPYTPDPLQKDSDEDELGDACDPDMDDDSVVNLEDNCPLVYNPDQSNEDPDIWGDACDDDDDGDGIRNTWDNCPTVANDDQRDLDDDQLGDACDSDLDGDTLINTLDNCPSTPNTDQEDADRDGVGDACDDRYCYVIGDEIADCLDPTDPFHVFSPDTEARTGDELRLRIFGNHANQPLRYTWTVQEAPRGSRAAIDQPSGACTISTPFEYHYLADRRALFTPDQPGSYTLKVYVELGWPDEVTGLEGTASEWTSTIEVEGEPTGGCSTVPLWAGAWLILPVLGFTRRRR